MSDLPNLYVVKDPKGVFLFATIRLGLSEAITALVGESPLVISDAKGRKKEWSRKERWKAHYDNGYRAVEVELLEVNA